MIENGTLNIPMDIKAIVQSTAMHFAEVKSNEDTENRNRILVECPSVAGEGKENWVGWVEYCGNPTGGDKTGDYGLHIPPKVGQMVLMGFEGGNTDRPYCLPGPTWGNGGKAPQTPDEVKTCKEDFHRVACWKSEAGHMIMMDDRGQKESLLITDWAGQSLFFIAPGKVKDADRVKPGEQSKPRQGELRDVKMTVLDTSKTPGEITKTDTAMMGFRDLNGQGIFTVSKDGEGTVCLMAGTGKGGNNPSIILDSKNNRILLTAGNAQVVVNGAAGVDNLKALKV